MICGLFLVLLLNFHPRIKVLATANCFIISPINQIIFILQIPMGIDRHDRIIIMR